MGLYAMILVFWMLSSKPAFSKRVLSSSLIFCHRVVSSAYLRLWIFLQLILIPAWASWCTLAFCMMYSAYKLNKWQYTDLTYSFPNLEPVCCSMCGSNCYFLTCIQISQESGKVVWYSHLLKNFPQFVVIHTVKSFSIVKEAGVDVFSGIFLLFLWSSGCCNWISGSFAFLKSSLYIWKFSIHVLLTPSLKNFEHYLVSMHLRRIIKN